MVEWLCVGVTLHRMSSLPERSLPPERVSLYSCLSPSRKTFLLRTSLRYGPKCQSGQTPNGTGSDFVVKRSDLPDYPNGSAIDDKTTDIKALAGRRPRFLTCLN